MVIENPKMVYTKVDGVEYGLVWFDRGNHRHLKVFRDGKLLGFKNFGLTVDTGDGVVAWSVRSILRKVKISYGLGGKKT